MTKERSTKIVNFNTPMAEVLMLGRGLISNFSEYVLSSTLSIYPAGIRRCTNVEIMLNLVDDVDQKSTLFNVENTTSKMCQNFNVFLTFKTKPNINQKISTKNQRQMTL